MILKNKDLKKQTRKTKPSRTAGLQIDVETARQRADWTFYSTNKVRMQALSAASSQFSAFNIRILGSFGNLFLNG